MAQSEFSLIDKYFKNRGITRDDVALAIGDDAAIAHVPSGCQLVTAVDTLVNGVHFPQDNQASDVGYKALAVNLSDIAAMGANPAWATLALTMPQSDEPWLQQFCDGFFELAQQFNVQLVGGDTTQGPLSVTVQLMGLVPTGTALTRSGARPGDRIFVSGTLGDAALGLHIYLQKNSLRNVDDEQAQALLLKLNRPQPRVDLGIALRGLATSAIDISDGLQADLAHILDASELGATINLECLPVSGALKSITDAERFKYVLSGGDDYELCFTIAESKLSEFFEVTRQLSIEVTEIGVIEQTPGLRLLNNGVIFSNPTSGFEHFSRP